MERGLHSGNVSISLVLLLLLPLLLGFGFGFGSSQTPGSAGWRDAGMERGLEKRGASPVIGGDVTVEDDDNGSAGEAEESYGESNGDVPASRYVTEPLESATKLEDSHHQTLSLWRIFNTYNLQTSKLQKTIGKVK